MGAFRNTATYWGHDLVVEHLFTIGVVGKGIDGACDVFVVADLYSGLRVGGPTVYKSSDATVKALQEFVGDRRLRRLYVDAWRNRQGGWYSV